MKAWLNRIRFNTGNERVILVVSMSVALLFWIFIKLSKTYQDSRSIGLEYRLPPGQVFSSIPPATLSATCTGHGWDLLSDYIRHPNPVIAIDLEARKNADVQREELIQKATEVLSLKVEDVSVNYIPFHLDSTATRLVPILLNFDISLASDFYILDSIRISPDSVLLTGPSKALAGLTSVQTEKLTLSDLRASVRYKVSLIPPAVAEVRLAKTGAAVEIPVEQFTEKAFSIPVKTRAGKDKFSLIPSHVELSFIVPLSRYDAIRAEDFEVTAASSPDSPQDRASIVALNLTKSPGGVKNVNFYPKSVELFLIH
jgi:YbbR-like protein